LTSFVGRQREIGELERLLHPTGNSHDVVPVRGLAVLAALAATGRGKPLRE
jgi:hypothetical protein